MPVLKCFGRVRKKCDICSNILSKPNEKRIYDFMHHQTVSFGWNRLAFAHVNDDDGGIYKPVVDVNICDNCATVVLSTLFNLKLQNVNFNESVNDYVGKEV